MAMNPRGRGHANDAVQDDAAAQQKLADAGYTNVAVTHHGRVWVGTATNSAGAAVHVVVHGKDGRISEDADDDAAPAAPPPTA